MDCLDDETLDALISGELSPAALERADAHIDDCADCRALVLELTAPQVPGVANSRMAPGASIGRFVVLEPLGAGGMGVVYAAYDPQLDRRVALKLVRTDTDHDPARARERLIREARAMAKLSHPNVVGVFDVGMVGQAVFVAMELVEGQNLRHWLAAKTRSWSELRQVYLQAAAGLSAAHAVGLVHRDFKPDNVIVGPEGRARVGDFGLARASTTAVTLESVPGPEGSSTMATTAAHSESSWAGTPAYMAPEVLAGKPADERSDQYSLCASLYEALAGTVPFPATSMAELMVRVQSGSIEPPKRRLGPGWLMAVAMRGLSRRPEDRFSTMQALARALRHDRRRRAVAGFGAGAVLLAGTTTGAFFVGQDRSPDAPAPCVHAQQALAEVWSDGDATALHTNFSRVSSVYGDATATSVERALDRWGERWTEAHRDTCEATHVRGEQSEALLDLRMACLRNRLGRVEALTQSFAEPDETIVEHAVEAVASLPTIAECSDARGLQAIEAPVDPAMAKAVEAEGPALA
ncbi:MAG: protein kinase, partial [Myxococcota bacterium]